MKDQQEQFTRMGEDVKLHHHPNHPRAAGVGCIDVCLQFRISDSRKARLGGRISEL